MFIRILIDINIHELLTYYSVMICFPVMIFLPLFALWLKNSINIINNVVFNMFELMQYICSATTRLAKLVFFSQNKKFKKINLITTEHLITILLILVKKAWYL